MLGLLKKAKTVPRWIILFIDLLIAAGSFSAAYLLTKHPANYNHLFTSHFWLFFTLYVAAAMVLHLAMQIHTGLIRFTNSQDMMRIFTAVFICNILFGVVCFSFFTKYVNPADVAILLLFTFSVQSSAMVLLRSAVRSVYFYIKFNSSANKKSVLIYGTNHQSILLKQALEGARSGNFYVAGFIDVNSPKINKYIEQRRVYPLSVLSEVHKRYNIKKVIIADSKLDDNTRQLLIDTCLQAGVKLSKVPPSDEWLETEGFTRQIKDLKIEDLLSREPIVIDTTKVSTELKGKRVLITGAAGSIGSEIVRQVLGYEPAMVALCDQAESPLHEVQIELTAKFPEAAMRFFIADVRNYKRMRTLFKEVRPEIIFHAAAYKHVPMMEGNAAEAVITNIVGTKNIADLAVYFDADKFVMISTDKAVNPTNIMGASKRIAEIYIQSLNDAITHSYEHLSLVDDYRSNATATVNTRFITTRFGNVLGSNGSVIPLFKAQIKKGGPVTVTHPDITRYFMTIPEAVLLVLEAGATDKGGEIFVFDMGEPVRIADMANKMIKLAGFTPGNDIQITYTGLRPGEKLYEELLNKEELTQPTHHEKIKIARVRMYDYKDVVDDVEELISLAQKEDDMAIVKKMKAIVPEYLSNNSAYQKLDDKADINFN